MVEDKIKFWMCRVLEEKTNDINILAIQISIYNHQIVNFKEMDLIFKKKVLNDLLKDLKQYDATQDMNWSSACKEIQEEINNLDEE